MSICYEVITLTFVSFVETKNSGYLALKESIPHSLNLINFNFARKVKSVIIKPNMCYYYHPSTGEVTDPIFVGALIEAIREKFSMVSEIFIVESDASAMRCKFVFPILGYDRLAKEKNVELINLSEMDNKIVHVNVNGVNIKFYVPKIFDETDLMINVPKPKYMEVVKISCALKNIFGCNAYPKKYVYHKILNEAIVGINKLIKSHLTIVDGIIVRGKYTKRLNMVVSGEDPVAVDAAVSEMMGINPEKVRYIALASKEKVGNINFLPIGNFLHFKNEFPKKKLKDNILEQFALPLYRKLFQFRE